MLKEIRIHGRGGQGVVTAAELLAVAAFEDGKYAQAFPSFGSERMGAPVQSFVRIADEKVHNRSQIYEPDFVIVVDSTLLRSVNCLAGFRDDGIAVINQREGVVMPKAKLKQKIFAVPANKIAQETIGRPLGNTALLGAYAAATSEIDLETMQDAVRKRFSGKIQEANLQAVKQGFEYIQNLE